MLIVGIVLALVLRVIFIALGAALLAAFSFRFLLFGLLLIATAVQLFRHRDQDPSVDDNALVTFARKRLPSPMTTTAASCSPALGTDACSRRCFSC